MRIGLVLLLVVFMSSGVAAPRSEAEHKADLAAMAAKEEAQRQSHKREFAFLMGMSSPGKVDFSWEVFSPAESSRRDLYNREARALAVSLGLAKPKIGSTEEESQWKFQLLQLLYPFYTEAWFSRGTSEAFVEEPQDLPYWDDATRRAYVVGAYCRFGHGNQIGYFAARKAWFVALLLNRLTGSDLEVSTHVEVHFPGGYRILLTENPKIQDIIAESRALLAAPVPRSEPTPAGAARR